MAQKVKIFNNYTVSLVTISVLYILNKNKLYIIPGNLRKKQKDEGGFGGGGSRICKPGPKFAKPEIPRAKKAKTRDGTSEQKSSNFHQ